jgi:hypothetical protein
MFVEYTGGAFDLTPMERMFTHLPFSSVGDLFCFIGVLVVAGVLIIFTVGKIAQSIKGDD